MTDERPTVRPVTLSRLVELVHLCHDIAQTTEEIEMSLDVTRRRARETILEALRIGLITERDEDVYTSSSAGDAFLDAVRGEVWSEVSRILAGGSPHYSKLLQVLDEQGPATMDGLLDALTSVSEDTLYSYNQTGVEIICDWAERLGVAQRNAFTGQYYPVERGDVPVEFPQILLEEYEDLEETAGVNLQQRYLSIPRLREQTCERLRCTRTAFDEGLLVLCQQNVGDLELAGAPLDTTAKDSALGIKQLAVEDDDALISTSQSTDPVMSGIEHFGKQYYYLTVHDHDRDLTFTLEEQ